MRRLLLVGAAALGVALLARRAARGCGGFDFERMVERMPENAPPKWMFRNISAIRDEHRADPRAARGGARDRAGRAGEDGRVAS